MKFVENFSDFLFHHLILRKNIRQQLTYDVYKAFALLRYRETGQLPGEKEKIPGLIAQKNIVQKDVLKQLSNYFVALNIKSNNDDDVNVNKVTEEEEFEKKGFVLEKRSTTKGDDGVFVKINKNVYKDGYMPVGTVMALHPGIVYLPSQRNQMRNYPDIFKDNDLLMSRYDGTILDASIWFEHLQQQQSILHKNIEKIENGSNNNNDKFKDTSLSLGCFIKPARLVSRLHINSEKYNNDDDDEEDDDDEDDEDSNVNNNGKTYDNASNSNSNSKSDRIDTTVDYNDNVMSYPFHFPNNNNEENGKIFDESLRCFIPNKYFKPPTLQDIGTKGLVKSIAFLSVKRIHDGDELLYNFRRGVWHNEAIVDKDGNKHFSKPRNFI